jgi:hypothetical protein
VIVYRAQLARAEALLSELLGSSGPADAVVSRYFRAHRNLGQQDRAFVAETVYAVLRRRRSLEAAAGSSAPRDLAIAALVRVRGLSGRALEGALREGEEDLVTRVRAAKTDAFSPAVRADLPDWLWDRLAALHGAEEAMRVAQGLLNPAPLDLRVNLAKLNRDEALAQLQASGVEAQATPYSPAGVRVAGKPAINRNPLFTSGAVEVQDEGSQLLAYLLAPRRGEMVADYCAGAGGKTLALAMLMRGTGRLYAMDVSARRLAELAPRAARAGVTSVHPLVLSGESDARAKRLAGKIACWWTRPAAASARCGETRTSNGVTAPRLWQNLPPSRLASWRPRRACSSREAASSMRPAASCRRKTKRLLMPSRLRTRTSRPSHARSCWPRSALHCLARSACACGRTSTAATASSRRPSRGEPSGVAATSGTPANFPFRNGTLRGTPNFLGRSGFSHCAQGPIAYNAEGFSHITIRKQR